MASDMLSFNKTWTFAEKFAHAMLPVGLASLFVKSLSSVTLKGMTNL